MARQVVALEQRKKL
ncbi:hypothetical protein ECPA14_4815, partial [Escherichia coli PA14]